MSVKCFLMVFASCATVVSFPRGFHGNPGSPSTTDGATLSSVRPDLRIAPPGNPNGALDLDGMFGLSESQLSNMLNQLAQGRQGRGQKSGQSGASQGAAGARYVALGVRRSVHHVEGVDARILRRDKEFGSLQKGMSADLLLVEGNPAKSVSDSRNVKHVFLRGRQVDRDSLKLKN